MVVLLEVNIYINYASLYDVNRNVVAASLSRSVVAISGAVSLFESLFT